MFKDVPPEILLSGAGLFFAVLFAMRARTVLVGDAGEGADGKPRSPIEMRPVVPPLAWPLTGLAVSIAFAAFVWTDTFTRLFESGWGGLLICAGILAWSGSEVIRAAATGRTSPIIRGDYGPYDRALQPKRFWASTLWNTALATLMAAATAGLVEDQGVNRCVDPADGTSFQSAIAACDLLLARADALADDRSYWLAARAYAVLDEDNAAAGADLDRALALDPENGWALRQRGYIRLHARQFEAAERDLTAGLAVDPDNAVALFDRARARASLGRIEGAMADINQAIELEPAEADFRQLRGEFNRAFGTPERAKADFAEAARLRATAAAD